jgi:16S rRNA (adenine1518-N6/adenine1519-N6)-dimethyltransferase
VSKRTKETLSSRGLAPSKKRGQNFLKSSATAQRIVAKADFSTADHVIEVGVGLGALTNCLASHVTSVIGIEVDRGLMDYLLQEQVLADNVELIHQDVLKTDFSALLPADGSRLKIISNLPYSISNPFIFKLINNRELIDSVVILLQKEMAERLAAQPGTKEYGIPSVLLQSCASIKKLMLVGADQFHPKPQVDSLLIRITFLRDAPPALSFGYLRATVRAAFSSRRKTLLNNLTASLPISAGAGTSKSDKRSRISQAIKAAGLDANSRAEILSVVDFQNLARHLQRISRSG